MALIKNGPRFVSIFKKRLMAFSIFQDSCGSIKIGLFRSFITISLNLSRIYSRDGSRICTNKAIPTNLKKIHNIKILTLRKSSLIPRLKSSSVAVT